MTDLHHDKLAELVLTLSLMDGREALSDPKRAAAKCVEAANTIEALQARLDTLEKALREIADDPYRYGQRVQAVKKIAQEALNG